MIHSGMVRDVGVTALAVSSTIHRGSVSSSLSRLHDDIELRICGDQSTSDEDTPIEQVEMYSYSLTKRTTIHSI